MVHLDHVVSAHERRARCRHVRHLVLMVTLVLPLVALVAAPVSAASAPKLRDPDATGERLATKFLTLLQSADTKGLAAFLDPAFQLQRADGTGATRAEYLANPSKVSTYQLGPDVIARQHGDVLTVRWTLEVDVTVDGTQYLTTEAPRLSGFRWDGRRWRMISHANFNVPA